MLSTRSAMCANGRYDSPTPSAGSSEVSCDTWHAYSAMRCVTTTPLGRPVVPEVYRTVSVESGVRSRHREVPAGSPASRNDDQDRYGSPAGQSSSTLTARGPGSRDRTGAPRSTWDGPTG